ncbi:hypothetical protein YYG_03845 [Plasmodium vinckei petteri]|uniref:Uncharacterized protein n=1 Tax=Plasmodium vinckei petteri TaxID=138298 RepID=W7AHK4_PLAVN|nr:hypothetical protein YYG_03845 [Plasmodium vinckei petteri]
MNNKSMAYNNDCKGFIYKDINTIDGYFYEEKLKGGGTAKKADKLITRYCPYYNHLSSKYCSDYFYMASSGVINLLENLEKYNLEYDKLAEYAILLLSYKLNQHSEHKYKFANLNTFYTNYIKTNNDYNKKIKDNGPTYKEIIDQKKDLMNIKEISKFNEAFSILCKLYNEINKTSDNLNKDIDKVVKDVPILLIHSVNDKKCSHEAAQDFYNNLKTKKKEFHTLEDMEHMITMEPGNEKVLKKLVDWLSDTQKEPKEKKKLKKTSEMLQIRTLVK